MRPQRLSNVWQRNPLYFISCTVANRSPILDTPEIAQILISEWKNALNRHDWAVGRYVIMPDHVHFFCSTLSSNKSLSKFIGSWKEWTSKGIKREALNGDFKWQRGFFDHLLRSDESRSEKWEYVRLNPVRAALVKSPDEWRYQGSIDFE